MNRNILLVSEQEQKAYLPYIYDDVERIYKESNGKYISIQDVIRDLYIVPLSNFKNAPFSRFRETINLVLHKEKMSIFKALDLAFELMFNYKLNPIVISACRNLEELDIYLDCLEENELFDFKCFEIRFEVTPDIYTNVQFGTGPKWTFWKIM